MQETIQQIEEINADIISLEQVGLCGKDQILNSFDLKYLKFQRYSFQWENLHKLENADPEIVFKPSWKENELRSYLQASFKKYLVEPSNTIIEVEKEKVVTKEVFRDKIVEKINRVEVKVPVQSPATVEYKEIIRPDELRVAHELLYGIGRPHNLQLALKIYNDEAARKNPSAFNILG
jgi:hypothetical protein